MEATALKIKQYKGYDTYIESLNYDLETLNIVVITPPLVALNVVFKEPIGFRCLNESDMLEFWENNVIVNNWFLKIHNSGWLAQESKRYGFLSKKSQLNEYLIKGQNECINILCAQGPDITRLNSANYVIKN